MKKHAAPSNALTRYAETYEVVGIWNGKPSIAGSGRHVATPAHIRSTANMYSDEHYRQLRREGWTITTAAIHAAAVYDANI